jgi:lysophospholipase L1-like esterase
MKKLVLLSLLVALTALCHAAEVPATLKAGDTVLIVGDSITEQKIYSVFMEDYLLMCKPVDNLRVSQVGWSGETAPGGLNRLQATMLPFAPTVVTVCYGMNDGGYGPLRDETAKRYRDAQSAIVEKFKAAGVRHVVLGVGAVDTDSYRKGAEQAAIYNKTLAAMGDIDKDIADKQNVSFTDLHGTLMDVMAKAKAKYGAAYDVCGVDGVHPGANGHLIMAYAYLKGLGCDGNIGTITFDAAAGTATATAGHKVVGADKTSINVESSRYPFCFTGDPKSPNATTGIIEFLPFNQELNRFVLVVKNPAGKKVKITWGKTSNTFDADAAAKGINLAAEFLDNPFSAPFQKVHEAVARQQSGEVAFYRQHFFALDSMKTMMPEEKETLERLNGKLAEKIKANRDIPPAAVVPVAHTITVEAAE